MNPQELVCTLETLNVSYEKKGEEIHIYSSDYDVLRNHGIKCSRVIVRENSLLWVASWKTQEEIAGIYNSIHTMPLRWWLVLYRMAYHNVRNQKLPEGCYYRSDLNWRHIELIISHLQECRYEEAKEAVKRYWKRF